MTSPASILGSTALDDVRGGENATPAPASAPAQTAAPSQLTRVMGQIQGSLKELAKAKPVDPLAPKMLIGG